MSLSVDYYLTLVLAVVLGVKYIVFDHDDDNDHVLQSSQDGATSMSAGDHANTTSMAAKTGGGSAGQTDQIRVISDVTADNSSLHRDDITPTASSLHGILLLVQQQKLTTLGPNSPDLLRHS